MEIIKYMDCFGQTLNESIGSNCVIRCPGLDNTLKSYYKDFPWMKSSLHIPPQGLVSFIAMQALNVYEQDMTSDVVYSDLCIEIDTLINEIAECNDDESLSLENTRHQYKDVFFALNDPARTCKQIEYIDKITYSLKRQIDNIGVKEFDVKMIKGDYVVIKAVQ